MVVPSGRFERPTSGLEDRRSDPLSYEGAGQRGGVEASRTPLHGFAGQPVAAPAPHLAKMLHRKFRLSGNQSRSRPLTGYSWMHRSNSMQSAVWKALIEKSGLSALGHQKIRRRRQGRADSTGARLPFRWSKREIGKTALFPILSRPIDTRQPCRCQRAGAARGSSVPQREAQAPFGACACRRYIRGRHSCCLIMSPARHPNRDSRSSSHAGSWAGTTAWRRGAHATLAHAVA
jgi:hypothetical protein